MESVDGEIKPKTKNQKPKTKKQKTIENMGKNRVNWPTPRNHSCRVNDRPTDLPTYPRESRDKLLQLFHAPLLRQALSLALIQPLKH